MSTRIQANEADKQSGDQEPRVRVCCTAALVWCLLAVAAQGQILYGSITGNVTDPSGAAVAGARVEATNVLTGV